MSREYVLVSTIRIRFLDTIETPTLRHELSRLERAINDDVRDRGERLHPTYAEFDVVEMNATVQQVGK